MSESKLKWLCREVPHAGEGGPGEAFAVWTDWAACAATVARKACQKLDDEEARRDGGLDEWDFATLPGSCPRVIDVELSPESACRLLMTCPIRSGSRARRGRYRVRCEVERRYEATVVEGDETKAA